MSKLIVFPHKPGSGGPGSFQKRFESELKKNGFKIGYLDQKNIIPDLIFVVGGTKKINKLLYWKRKNVPIFYRLDGINWLHRVRNARQSNFKNIFRSEIINLSSKLIHGYIADFIVYQSDFVKNWWNKKGFKKRNNFKIIHNGVDLQKFENLQTNKIEIKIVILEGLLDYSPYAIDLINELALEYGNKLEVYGGIHYKEEREKLSNKVNYKGIVDFNEIPNIYKNSIYISLDINPACPNTVIEALASGAPVVGFDTGAIKELVKNGSGICVNYGSDPWKLENPNLSNLKEAIHTILENYQEFSINARKHAVENFSIEYITNKYLEIIKKHLND